ncbi:hypothetical protein [Aquimarina sp. RZ0]|uniref:hypothetical protein n=1 Tax=Aquimarina sp. RZ0 TaxID=2607730 RepID=UPI0011F35A44|nr:hypothetical protein [Aquimarina sp. RZ0]KAA1242505.1 hypothetical protein F0000_25305 [Aquimarina sp. RZ0]
MGREVYIKFADEKDSIFSRDAVFKKINNTLTGNSTKVFTVDRRHLKHKDPNLKQLFDWVSESSNPRVSFNSHDTDDNRKLHHDSNIATIIKKHYPKNSKNKVIFHLDQCESGNGAVQRLFKALDGNIKAFQVRGSRNEVYRAVLLGPIGHEGSALVKLDNTSLRPLGKPSKTPVTSNSSGDPQRKKTTNIRNFLRFS